MKKLTLLLGTILLLQACGGSSDNSQENNSQNTDVDTANVSTTNKEEIIKEKLKNIEITGNIYNEYYPGTKKLKFQGPQDDQGERHGKWLYFSEDGTELSMTVYDHGKKHGHSIVKYPNGAIHYIGEYRNDKPIGIWKTYSISGELTNEKDYGQPEDVTEN